MICNGIEPYNVLHSEKDNLHKLEINFSLKTLNYNLESTNIDSYNLSDRNNNIVTVKFSDLKDNDIIMNLVV
jgi:hypothetical protein